MPTIVKTNPERRKRQDVYVDNALSSVAALMNNNRATGVVMEETCDTKCQSRSLTFLSLQCWPLQTYASTHSETRMTESRTTTSEINMTLTWHFHRWLLPLVQIEKAWQRSSSLRLLNSTEMRTHGLSRFTRLHREGRPSSMHRSNQIKLDCAWLYNCYNRQYIHGVLEHLAEITTVCG